MTFLISGAVIGVVVFAVWRYIGSLDTQKKTQLKDSITNVFVRAEEQGRFPRYPAFETEYLHEYPDFKKIEDQYPVIREECEALMADRDKLIPMASLGGGYTAGDTHVAKWTTLMFKSGQFIEENCALAPRTAAILRQIPRVYTAFFSVLEPHQHIAPHYGYYKGFIRYHMGVMIPGNNQEESCWIRVNADQADNDADDKTLIEKGERYYWRNGEGVMLDDTFMHEAANESDEVRVILFLDVARRMPWYLDIFNRIVLFVVHREGSVKSIREAARIGGS
ncbi:MAG: aspartyl/asparaginyl beta-hydroxylase domain-containing protein [Myxococcota bacterium]|nr:aspartyl/asparaginyl beta-hydroxylase domain-containing protein [Myxococcota bacterium]